MERSLYTGLSLLASLFLNIGYSRSMERARELKSVDIHSTELKLADVECTLRITDPNRHVTVTLRNDECGKGQLLQGWDSEGDLYATFLFTEGREANSLLFGPPSNYSIKVMIESSKKGAQTPEEADKK